ncbi:hypothetical protein DC487_04725 [Sphingobacterium corticibacter]|uniref:Uncharacterized protein n=1 Tax=Sphingobacterium corticibacter TaxID=2171749 RepID=A0A2T8HNC1_9SPHI|nr:hypothetical protein DC487_04725 [Sphingobacterium corticibacter]
METHIRIAGIISILLATIHIFFPSYFQWKKHLEKWRLIDRQIMLVHTFFIALIIFLTGLLSVTSADVLFKTRLGHQVCCGLGIFWLLRLYFQLFVYSSTLWKGKLRETSIHIIFLMLWVYMSVVYVLSAYLGPTTNG